LVKNHKVFPSNDTALKVFYLAVESTSKKWAMPIRSRKPAQNKFMIELEEELTPYVNNYN